MIKILQSALSVFWVSLLLAGMPTQESSAHERNGVRNVSSNLCAELLAQGGVFIFFDASCPICAEYFPTIELLSAKYKASEPFYFVFKADNSAAMESFLAEYHPQSFVLSDTNSTLQEALGAQVTPQAFLVHGGKVIYSGRIDDRYESIGHRRGFIRTHDLELALATINKGNLAQAKTTTRPVGCFIEVKKHKPLEEPEHVYK